MPPHNTFAWAYNMALKEGPSDAAADDTTPSQTSFVVDGPWGAAAAGAVTHVGYQVNATSADFMPHGIALNGVPCALSLAPDPAAPVPPLAPDHVLADLGLAQSWAAERPVSTRGHQFIGVDGAPFTMAGVNWFGFENGQTSELNGEGTERGRRENGGRERESHSTTPSPPSIVSLSLPLPSLPSPVVDGLWGNVQNPIVADFATVAWRIKLLGFNTIRLPFSFKEFTMTPRDPKYSTCSSAAADPATMAKSVTPPGVTLPAGSLPPRLHVPASPTSGVCNDYVPMESVRTRFLWACKWLAANGFYVVIDDHMAYDTLVREREPRRRAGGERAGEREGERGTAPPAHTSTSQPPRPLSLPIHLHSSFPRQILDDTPKWVQSWKELARDIAADPVMRNRVMLDIINEPDSRGIKWATGPKGVGMATYYEQAMDAIHSVHPTALLLLEGAGQLGTVAMNWGDGFATDPAVVAAGGVESARPFFEKMMGKPYLRNIVLAPHIYPPSVSTHHEPEVVNAPGLFTRLDNSFGTLTKKGFCPTSGGACITFPVVFGETGSKMNPEDLRMLKDFARYMTAGTAGHNAMPNMLWWDWNANSGDTGVCGERAEREDRERGRGVGFLLSPSYPLLSTEPPASIPSHLPHQAASSRTTGPPSTGTRSPC